MKIRLGYKDADIKHPLYYRVRDRAGNVKDGEAHIALCAPTRAGKFTDILGALMMEFESSLIVIDPKGQAAAVTGPQRARMGQRVIILNPFGILPDVLTRDSPEHFGRLSAQQKDNCVFNATFDPMAGLDPNSESFGADCDSLADAIVLKGPESRDSHWIDSAQEIVAGLIMHLARNAPARHKNLARLRRLITGKRSQLCEEARAASESDDGFIGERLDVFADDDPKNAGELASIISTAKTQTRFISNAAIANSLSGLTGPSFRFRVLRRTPTTVYLVLPTRYLATCAKWFRLVIAAALDDLLREPEDDDLKVLAVLDEFSQLGKLASIENAMGLAAGYGLQLFTVVQDLTRLKEHYGAGWETFLANAGVSMFFAPRDSTTRDYVSGLTGITEVPSKTVSTSEVSNEQFMHGFGGVGTSITMRERALYQPHHVGQIGSDRFLLFMEGVKNVFEGWRQPYWAGGFEGKYSPDPYHRRRR